MIRRIAAIAGSAIFLVVAPGFVAGLAPRWISRWHFEPPLFGLPFLSVAGAVLIALGAIGLVDSFDSPLGSHRIVSFCAKFHVRRW